MTAPAPAPTSPVPHGLAERLVGFCRALRERGLPVTMAETLDAARALDVVDVTDREELRATLACVLTSGPADSVVFDELFDAWWRADGAIPAPPPPSPRPPDAALLAPRARGITLERWLRRDEAAAEWTTAIPAPSARERLREGAGGPLGADELAEITRLARRLARRLALRRSRRWRAARRGARVDLRRTARLALHTGGEAIRLARRARRLRRSRLLVLCDVSGSMDAHARFVLQLVYALQHSFARVESFVFATRLSRVTAALSDARYDRALERAAALARDWSGGTRIGASLAAFEAGWGHLVDRRTVLVVLSDGWDTDDPARLGRVMASLHRRAGRVVWLDPLLGTPGYAPLTAGMQAALPHVDVLAPVGDVASLRRLVKELVI